MAFSIPINENPNDTFWLARHAHNVLAPLIEAARQYEPGIHYGIILRFDVEQTYRRAGSYLEIHAHWTRPSMLLHESNLITTQQIAAVAAKVQTFIDAEQVKLEEAEDAAAEALAYEAMLAEADAAADQAWDAQLERAAERADIERDEHYHDIELQNEMAGN